MSLSSMDENIRKWQLTNMRLTNYPDTSTDPEIIRNSICAIINILKSGKKIWMVIHGIKTEFILQKNGCLKTVQIKEKKPKAVGIRKASAKLNDEKVREIRKKYEKMGISFSQLAKEYKLNINTIIRVIHRRTWNHVE